MSKIYLNPPYSKWSELLEYNLSSNNKERSVLEQSKELRTLLFGLSSYFSRKLGLSTTDVEYGEGVKIILSAHQPSFDHPGLLAKKQYLSKFASENNCIGINIILDTDSGDSLDFKYIENNEIKKSDIFNEHHDKAYCFQKKHFDVDKLVNCKLPKEFIDKFNNEEKDFIEAITEFRRTYEDSPSYFELPFSFLVEQANFQKFIFEYFLISFKHLFFTYNNVLGIYRALKKIKNKANPFPDLKEKGDSLELPFWLIDKEKQTKEPLYVTELEDKTLFHTEDKEFKLSLTGFMGFPPLPEGVFILPRALITTAIFRVFLCDFFIHGKGGEKYDACTDAFITSFFNFDPPKFAAVSRDLMIDAEKASEALEYMELKDQTREIAFHPEKYLEKDLFNKEDSLKLNELVKSKSDLINEIKRKKQDKESVASETKAIKEIEKEVFSLVEAAIAAKYSNISQLSESQFKTILSRKYPFFIFEKSTLSILNTESA